MIISRQNESDSVQTDLCQSLKQYMHQEMDRFSHLQCVYACIPAAEYTVCPIELSQAAVAPSANQSLSSMQTQDAIQTVYHPLDVSVLQTGHEYSCTDKTSQLINRD